MPAHGCGVLQGPSKASVMPNGPKTTATSLGMQGHAAVHHRRQGTHNAAHSRPQARTMRAQLVQGCRASTVEVSAKDSRAAC